jgi:hypothetical protein
MGGGIGILGEMGLVALIGFVVSLVFLKVSDVFSSVGNAWFGRRKFVGFRPGPRAATGLGFKKRGCIMFSNVARWLGRPLPREAWSVMVHMARVVMAMQIKRTPPNMVRARILTCRKHQIDTLVEYVVLFVGTPSLDGGLVSLLR